MAAERGGAAEGGRKGTKWALGIFLFLWYLEVALDCSFDFSFSFIVLSIYFDFFFNNFIY